MSTLSIKNLFHLPYVSARSLYHFASPCWDGWWDRQRQQDGRSWPDMSSRADDSPRKSRQCFHSEEEKRGRKEAKRKRGGEDKNRLIGRERRWMREFRREMGRNTTTRGNIKQVHDWNGRKRKEKKKTLFPISSGLFGWLASLPLFSLALSLSSSSSSSSSSSVSGFATALSSPSFSPGGCGWGVAVKNEGSEEYWGLESPVRHSTHRSKESHHSKQKNNQSEEGREKQTDKEEEDNSGMIEDQFLSLDSISCRYCIGNLVESDGRQERMDERESHLSVCLFSAFLSLRVFGSAIWACVTVCFLSCAPFLAVESIFFPLHWRSCWMWWARGEDGWRCISHIGQHLVEGVMKGSHTVLQEGKEGIYSETKSKGRNSKTQGWKFKDIKLRCSVRKTRGFPETRWKIHHTLCLFIPRWWRWRVRGCRADEWWEPMQYEHNSSRLRITGPWTRSEPNEWVRKMMKRRREGTRNERRRRKRNQENMTKGTDNPKNNFLKNGLSFHIFLFISSSSNQSSTYLLVPTVCESIVIIADKQASNHILYHRRQPFYLLWSVTPVLLAPFWCGWYVAGRRRDGGGWREPSRPGRRSMHQPTQYHHPEWNVNKEKKEEKGKKEKNEKQQEKRKRTRKKANKWINEENRAKQKEDKKKTSTVRRKDKKMNDSGRTQTGRNAERET